MLGARAVPQLGSPQSKLAVGSFITAVDASIIAGREWRIGVRVFVAPLEPSRRQHRGQAVLEGWPRTPAATASIFAPGTAGTAGTVAVKLAIAGAELTEQERALAAAPNAARGAAE